MPDINPTASDLVEVTLHPINGPPTVVLAKIMTKDPSGKWQIELAGIPPMKGLIDIANYKWEPELSRWIKLLEIQEEHVRPLQKTVAR